jgi:hypothetical protein
MKMLDDAGVALDAEALEVLAAAALAEFFEPGDEMHERIGGVHAFACSSLS